MMQTVVTDVCGVCQSVRPSISLSVCHTVCAVCVGVIWCSLCQITLASCYKYLEGGGKLGERRMEMFIQMVKK